MPYERITNKILTDYQRNSEDDLIQSLTLFIRKCREGTGLEGDASNKQGYDKSKRIEELSQMRPLPQSS